jgi:cerevisin
MKGFLALSLLPLLAVASPVISIGSISEDSAPILSASNAAEVPDSYIVVFKDHVTHAGAQEHHSWVQDVHFKSENIRTELRKRGQEPISSDVFGGLKHTYKIGTSLLGYSGHFDEETIEKVRHHPDVSTFQIAHLELLSSFNPIPLLHPENINSLSLLA